MKTHSKVHTLIAFALGVWAMALNIVDAIEPFNESLTSHDNFIIAHNWGPDRWGCSFTRTQVHETDDGTKITIGKDSDRKPYSCGELIYRQANLSYGNYQIEMIASNIVGQVTSFFLIANGDTEIDIELTGLNNRVGWMNIWNDNKQNPVSIDLPFDSSKDWHSYQFEWRPQYVAWSVDGNVVLNRSDIRTTPPDQANYKLAINSWTQVQPEVNIEWAGKFTYPNDGRIPQAHFRNINYTPWSSNQSNNGHKQHTDDDESNEAGLNAPKDGSQKISNAGGVKSPESILAIGSGAIVAVAMAFTVWF